MAAIMSGAYMIANVHNTTTAITTIIVIVFLFIFSPDDIPRYEYASASRTVIRAA